MLSQKQYKEYFDKVIGLDGCPKFRSILDKCLVFLNEETTPKQILSLIYLLPKEYQLNIFECIYRYLDREFMGFESKTFQVLQNCVGDDAILIWIKGSIERFKKLQIKNQFPEVWTPEANEDKYYLKVVENELLLVDKEGDEEQILGRLIGEKFRLYALTQNKNQRQDYINKSFLPFDAEGKLKVC